MSRHANDVTHLVQRVERLEDRWGFALEGLSAWVGDRSETVEVSGELRSTKGLQLERSTLLVFACYDENSRVISVTKRLHSAESFFGFAVFSVELPTLGCRISKLLIYPTPF
jgi:hypothetical protein